MNVKRAILTGIVLFIALFVMDFAINGSLLAHLYQQTASVWRPQADMERLFAFMIVGQFFFGFFYAIIFAIGFNPLKSGVAQGLRYGILMSLLLAPLYSLGWYVVLPIPALLAILWFVAMVIELLVMGLLAGLIYKPAQQRLV